MFAHVGLAGLDQDGVVDGAVHDRVRPRESLTPQSPKFDAGQRRVDGLEITLDRAEPRAAGNAKPKAERWQNLRVWRRLVRSATSCPPSVLRPPATTDYVMTSVEPEASVRHGVRKVRAKVPQKDEARLAVCVFEVQPGRDSPARGNSNMVGQPKDPSF